MPGDPRHMELALSLARRGEGYVEPNPMVGAVVVAPDGRVVGTGWHQKFGGPHAEVHALREAGELARGATLYVTLEPCCHTGKTPPCTEAIIAAGIARVVVAVEDPFPKVDGGGLRQLAEAGIPCEVGLLADEARHLLAPYLKRLATGRPWVIAKWAMTLDGKIATGTGSSQWISGETSRAVVHKLRGRVDAILVGAGTVRADDPLLTARPPGRRTAVRYVLGDIPVASQLVRTAREGPLVVAIGPHIPQPIADELLSHGAQVWRLDSTVRGDQVAQLLDQMAAHGVTNLLVEGGARLLGELFDLRAIDEVHAFVAPKLVGGTGALSPIGGVGLGQMAEALALGDCRVQVLDRDIYVTGRTTKKS
jgi:diaminohydroxyphosphoribosylaminopyrimidine deaminase/5-amino-6-(5-phosphoribosylamino)uracil reductase